MKTASFPSFNNYLFWTLPFVILFRLRILSAQEQNSKFDSPSQKRAEFLAPNHFNNIIFQFMPTHALN